MRKIIINSILLILFLAVEAFSCDSQMLEKNLIEFCSGTAKLDYNVLTSLEAFPDEKLKLNECSGSTTFIYSPTPPYKIIRYPFRSYDNQVYEIQGKSKIIDKATEESLKTKKVSAFSLEYGPPELGLQKNFLVLACDSALKNQTYMVVTSYISSIEKPYLASTLFAAPGPSVDRNLYLIVANPASSLADKSQAIVSLYEKSILMFKKDSAKKIDLSDEALDSILLNNYHKDKVVEYVLSKLQKNEYRNMNDMQGAIEAYLEKALLTSPTLGRLVKQHRDQKNLIAESAKLKQMNTALVAENNELKKSQMLLWQKNNYTYSVVASILFFIISVVFGILLYRK